MRIALVHYWLLGDRGGEPVLEAICRLFPEAEIFTLFYDPDSVSLAAMSAVTWTRKRHLADSHAEKHFAHSLAVDFRVAHHEPVGRDRRRDCRRQYAKSRRQWRRALCVAEA